MRGKAQQAISNRSDIFSVETHGTPIARPQSRFRVAIPDELAEDFRHQHARKGRGGDKPLQAGE